MHMICSRGEEGEIKAWVALSQGTSEKLSIDSGAGAHVQTGFCSSQTLMGIPFLPQDRGCTSISPTQGQAGQAVRGFLTEAVCVTLLPTLAS